jgi:hypothetical protein
MQQRICKNCETPLYGFKYSYCTSCRSNPEFSENNFLRCLKCNKNLKSMKHLSQTCRACTPKKTRQKGLDYARSRKNKLNGIENYTDLEIKEFLNTTPLDFNSLRPNEFLLFMLKTIQYHESKVAGTELINGPVREQLRRMLEELYKNVYFVKKKSFRNRGDNGKFINSLNNPGF